MSDDNIVEFVPPKKIVKFDDDYDDSLGSMPLNPIAYEKLHHAVQQAINEREDRGGFEAFGATALMFPDCHPSGVIYVAVNRAAKMACCLYKDHRLLSKIHPDQIDIAIGPVWIEADKSEDQGEQEFTEVLAAKKLFEILNDIEGYSKLA
ncbi:hypothetical protein [Ensifer sp. 4252]|uniref:hypothetical protein n=1 Tax=Ensifer sp. 4252 TaxID=3373915 RepID=UPI003D25FAC8